jgi:hypothetical protein
MAIAAVSSISSFSPFFPLSSISPLFARNRVGAIGKADLLPPVQSIPALVRDGSDSSAEEQKDGEPLSLDGRVAAALGAKAPALDRRSADSLVDPSAAKTELSNLGETPEAGGRPKAEDRDVGSDPLAGRKPSEVELQGRLTELEGEKARKERERAGDQSERSSEVSSLISRLKARDGEVRAHEAAHMAAGGRYITGGANYSYQKGPDGVQYAIGGEVGIDSSPISGKPEETIAKMRVVRAAALAPAEPSGADLAVAGAAAQAEAQAMASLAEEQGQRLSASTSGADSAVDGAGIGAAAHPQVSSSMASRGSGVPAVENGARGPRRIDLVA